MTLQIEDEYLDIIIAVGHAANMIFEKAYVVGGFVRDTIMGIPSDDLDFLCTDIDKLSDEILWHHGETKELYETITPTYRTCVIQWGNIKIDLVEPRKETYVSDSIKPLVEKGTFEDDIARRDFTINALTMGCSYDDLYYIYDRTNGLMDLENKILRCIGDPYKRFTEDPTRLLRAVRFASTRDMIIEPKTLKAMRKLAPQIKRVPSELILKEIHKSLYQPTQSNRFLRLLEQTHLLKEVFPELEALRGVYQHPGYHTQDVLEHTILAFEQVPLETSGNIKMAVMLHDIGKATTSDNQGHAYGHPKVSHSLASNRLLFLTFSKKEMKEILYLIQHHHVFHNLALDFHARTFRRVIFKHAQHLADLELMTRCDIISDNPEPEKAIKRFDQIVEKLKSFETIELTHFKLALDGNEIRDFGFEGKNIGTMIQILQNFVVRGTLLNTKKALQEYIIDYKQGSFML